MNLSFSPSLASAFYVFHSPEEAMVLLKNAGFSYAELCFEHVEVFMERAKSIAVSVEKIGQDFRSLQNDLGISTPQGHLSFLKGLCTDGMVDLLKRELDLFQAIGIRKAVIHLNGGDSLPDEERIEKKLNCLSELLNHIHGTEITLCMENLPSNPDVRSVKSLLKYIDLLGEKNLGICLDTGHLHLTNHRGHTNESHADFIRAAGRHLQALHIANNDGTGDFHLEPFAIRNGVNFQSVVKTLCDVQYSNLFNLEVHGAVNCPTAPFAVKQLKVQYIRAMLDYMLCPDFLSWDGVKL